MKISELEAILKNYKDLYGDIEVKLNDEGWEGSRDAYDPYNTSFYVALDYYNKIQRFIISV